MTIPFNKRLFLGASLLCCLMLSKNSSAQFIRLTITIPPGIEMNAATNPPQIIEAPLGQGGMRGINQKGYRWIELRSLENIEFLISWKPTISRYSVKNEFYYLNDNTVNLANAQSLMLGTKSLTMYQDHKMIDQIPDNPKFLSSWLGVPVNANGVLTIIYL